MRKHIAQPAEHQQSRRVGPAIPAPRCKTLRVGWFIGAMIYVGGLIMWMAYDIGSRIVDGGGSSTAPAYREERAN